MRGIICILLVAGMGNLVQGQAGGFGYYFDIGGDARATPNGVYGQSILSISHNGFIRIHSKSSWSAVQLLVAYRQDYINFQNFSNMLSPDGQGIEYLNVDAQIDRDAWRFALINQFQLGANKNKFCLAINPGLYFERTLEAYRSSDYDYKVYQLNEELNPNTVGWILGAELRFGWFTIGYKMEQAVNTVLNYDIINNWEYSGDNNLELRGLWLNPIMNYVFVGVHFDFY